MADKNTIGGLQIPTDRQILEAIYLNYYTRFQNDANSGKRQTVIFVPLDLEMLGKKLGMDPDILFGRLYHDLDGRYKYSVGENSWVRLFPNRVGTDMHAINFPYLAGILSRLQYEENQAAKSVSFSLGSLIVALFSLLISGASLWVAITAGKS